MLDRHIDRLTQVIITGSIHQIIEGFLLDRRAQGLSPQTIRFYSQELNYFLSFLNRQNITRIDDLSSDIIRFYLLHLAERRNPGGCHVAYRAIRALTYWWEIETDGEYRSPVRKVRAPKVVNNPIPGISPGEIELMLQACRGELALRDRAIILTLYDTGARAAELVGLDLDNLNLVTGAIWIKSGKGGKSRIVFVGRTTRRSLRAYLKSRPESGPVFLTDDGQRLSIAGLRQVLRRRAAAAGLAEPGAHDFRRAFALAMLRAGCDLAALSQLMGHASLDVLRRYLRLVEGDLRAAHRVASPADRLK